MHILVAEDEPIVRGLAQEILQDHGYRVLAANDGIQALEMARQHDGSIDLLLTDVVMPRMGGGELARRLQARRPEMRVLYMSGYTDHFLLRQDWLGPGAAFLQKPFSPEGLARRVREALDRSR